MKVILKYFKLYLAFWGYALNRDLQYRVNFLVLVFGYVFYLISNVLFFSVIYYWTNSFGGWNYYEMLIFVGTYHIIHGVWDFSTALNIDRISEYVVKGTLDQILMKPVNSLFYILFRNMNFSSLINVILGSILVFGGVNQNIYEVSPALLFLYIVLCINGVIIFTMLQLLLQLMAFWFVKVDILNSIFYQVIKFAEKPDTIYTGILRRIFIFGVPMIIIVNCPSRLLMGRLEGMWLVYNVLVTIILLYLGILGWHYAIKKYNSAN